MNARPIRHLLFAVLLAFPLFLPSPAPAYERRTPVVDAVEKAGKAVVNIRTEQIVRRRSSPFFGFADPFFDDFFRDLAPTRTYKTQSLGSGVIIDPKGYVLTNAHVIEKASKIFVALPDSSKEIEASLVGMDARIDLAILRLPEKGAYPALPPARSDDLMLGETVIAIGNPLGLGHSITTGVVSAPRRRIDLDEKAFSVFIQTDALINPGNSGGPLININGELIGINTAIVQQAQGIGFAIPIDTAKRVANDLIAYGRIRPSFLGIVPKGVDTAFSDARGAGGVFVSAIEQGSPAEKAGLKVADVVVTLDGTTVESPAELFGLLRSYPPGGSIRLGFLRGMQEKESTVHLAPLPHGYGLRYGENAFGFSVSQGDGVVVKRVFPRSAAEKVGIERGDIIAEIAGERLQTVEDYTALIESYLGQEPLRFLIVRGNRGYYVELP